ncbi:MAG TPA: M23 family metallopeptidase [Woeseiaceae bacterium]|nr:M23 family metallopeptidase [Woeseiaceae bacterium]
MAFVRAPQRTLFFREARGERKIPLACACLLAGLLLPAADPSARCSGDWICIEATREAGEVELSAANLRNLPITFTLRVRTRHLRPADPEITATLAPHEKRVVLVLRATDEERQSRYRIAYDWTVGSRDAVHDDSHVYRLPYAPGRSYRVLQGYGSGFSHTGLEEFAVDFKMPEGTPVHAARGGIVARIEESHSRGCWDDGCGDYANYIVILHDDLTTGEYYHLQQDGVLVEPGERVEAGQRIGLSGNTGHTTTPHLHFAVYRAVEWGRTQSLPVRFLTAGGIVERPRRGDRYRVP